MAMKVGRPTWQMTFCFSQEFGTRLLRDDLRFTDSHKNQVNYFLNLSQVVLANHIRLQKAWMVDLHDDGYHDQEPSHLL